MRSPRMKKKTPVMMRQAPLIIHRLFLFASATVICRCSSRWRGWFFRLILTGVESVAGSELSSSDEIRTDSLLEELMTEAHNFVFFKVL